MTEILVVAFCVVAMAAAPVYVVLRFIRGPAG